MIGNPERRGISLIEVLVVIAVMGLLCALIVPAVQASRRTARAIQCKDHLRQVGIATASYESSKGHWPGRLMDVMPFCDQGPGHGILLDWESKGNETGFFPKLPPLPNISTFVCPEDSRIPARHQGLVSYHMNDGTSTTRDNRAADGIVGKNPVKPLMPSKVSDGLSTTAMFSERLVFASRFVAEPPDPVQRSAWGLADGAASPTGLLNASTSAVWLWSKAGYRRQANGGRRVIAYETRYEHVLPPNYRPVFSLTKDGYHSTRPATSQHDGGVHVTYCDGHVTFTSNAIDVTVWRALGTRAGGELAEVQ